MYSIQDKSAAVRRLQTYLLEISYAWDGLPHIAVDGIAGEETGRALRLFQAGVGLPATGYADADTWEALTAHYNSALAARTYAPTLLPPSALPITPRSAGSEVAILTLLLAELGAGYPDMPRISPRRRYDTETAEAVRVYQSHNSLPPSGIVDGATWERLAEEYRRKEEK